MYNEYIHESSNRCATTFWSKLVPSDGKINIKTISDATISGASIEVSNNIPANEKVILYIKINDNSEVILCNFVVNKSEDYKLNLMIDPDTNVQFRVKGKCSVNVYGNFFSGYRFEGDL